MPSQSQPQIVCFRDVFLLLRLVVLSLLASDPWALVCPHAPHGGYCGARRGRPGRHCSIFGCPAEGRGCCRFKVRTTAAASTIWEKHLSKAADSVGRLLWTESSIFGLRTVVGLPHVSDGQKPGSSCSRDLDVS